MVAAEADLKGAIDHILAQVYLSDEWCIIHPRQRSLPTFARPWLGLFGPL